MTCTPLLIEAWLDDELDVPQALEVERHLAACPTCAQDAARLREQKTAIRSMAPRYEAPPVLRESVRAVLREAAEREAKAARPERSWRGLALAASVLLAVSLGWNLMQLRTSNPEGNVADAVFADHIRSLLGTHLVDVVSSDQHTVKPWFAGRLDFSPVVKDLSAEGFPLEGGRMEYMAGRRVAALVFRRRQHVINLFTWPAESGSQRAARISHDGYNLLHWLDGPMSYWAVSDASAEELEHFRTLYGK